MEYPKINAGTEVLYAHGTSRRYWIKETKQQQREPRTKADGTKEKNPRWDIFYHLLDEKGNTTTTKLDEDLIPVEHPRANDNETPSAIKFLRRIQQDHHGEYQPGDLVTLDEEVIDEDGPNNSTQDVHRITHLTWHSETDDSPFYGFWMHHTINLTKNRQGEVYPEYQLHPFTGPQPE